MKILLLAPHPFYQERGTPIAVDMLLRVLSAEGHNVDVCTFPEGEARYYKGVTVYRASPWGTPTGIGPGFSIKKLYTDLFLFRLAAQLCRESRYDVVHAIEEAGFLGWYLQRRYGIPYVYDMDSVLSDQLIDSRPWLAPSRRVLEGLENKVVTGACVVAPMCRAIADRAASLGHSEVVVLKDVSLIPGQPHYGDEVEDLRRTLKIDRPMAMYIGNLETYQGIDLLLGAFHRALQEVDAELVIIGGKPDHVAFYGDQARRLGIAERVHLIGPRPVTSIGGYLTQADVLVSPRTKGSNTPMKVYSYLHSGVALLATALPTHTQVLDDDIAELAAPDIESFGSALARLLGDPSRRTLKGERAAAYADAEHSFESFRRSVNTLYARVAELCRPGRA